MEAVRQTDVSSETHYVPGSGKSWGSGKGVARVARREGKRLAQPYQVAQASETGKGEGKR